MARSVWGAPTRQGQSLMETDMLFWVTALWLLLAVVAKSHGQLEEPVDVTSCDFETSQCSWAWNTSLPHGFAVVNATKLRQEEFYRGPPADASHNPFGQFLLLEMTPANKEMHVWSQKLSHTRQLCKLHVFLSMGNMTSGNIKVVVETKNTSWLVDEKLGNNRNLWEKYEFLIGRVQQEFQIILEVTSGDRFPAHLLMDNIKLVDCFPDTSTLNCSNNSSSLLFRCSKDSDDFCINKTQVCDIEQDCWNGEDEKQGCDKVPEFARCTFEEGWCGWENSPTSAINWTRQNGSAYGKKVTGPAFDHTYQNASGMYLYVNFTTSTETKLGSSAVLESSLINPPPKYHSNRTSAFYRSCFVRFFYQHFGQNYGSFGLMLIEKGHTSDKIERLWYQYNSKDSDHAKEADKWHRQIVVIPENITHRYMLQFEVRRGLRARGDLAIDDVTMSPECFGLNVPPNETAGYDYDNFDANVEPTKIAITREDFVRAPIYLFTSCGVRGRYGPTPANCSRAYNNTRTNVTVMQDATVAGVQRWIVPEEGYYTIIAKGASGGKGSDGGGFSKGASASGVMRLNRTQALYIIVGQEGGSACSKILGTNHECKSEFSKKFKSSGLEAIKELKKIDYLREGGGGGGASVVHLWYKTKGRVPLVIGSGGGGLGGDRSRDDDRQHGSAMDANRLGVTAMERGKNESGAGGGWLEANATLYDVTGQSLTMGGRGGRYCDMGHSGQNIEFYAHGHGGFGGGGGGCTTGGGGGGFAGGATYSRDTDEYVNGHGGYSYVSNVMILRQTEGASNRGPGHVIIIPAIRGCGCAYRCVALDERRSQTRCVCPLDHRLMDNNVDCEAISVPVKVQNDHFVTVLAVVIACIILLAVAFLIYKHHRHRQKKKAMLRLNKINDSDLQLNRLRVASDSMMTEYNPNYEFGGGTYTIRDLPEVPREHLRLVKALGQGAFGEVYQGFYRHRSGDAVEMPVAVKTLPELSTNQAETDFLMEALIMSKFNHPNIVHFIGVCFDRHPRLIVLELLAGGDLKNFLRESRPKPERPSPLNMKDLLMCAVDIAKGCTYLEENHFIHRDIAARNCLLTTKGPGRTCKIADFGMARDIYRCDYYRKGGKAMLPIKWMPPEAFQDGIFTSKTDVWSFGVLLWEVMSLGYMPYTGCGNREVMQLVITGGRLEPPCNCPEAVYAVMTKCWHPKPDERPSFKMIMERLGYCVQDPDVLNTPLPIFNRLTWSERDTTATQSEATTSTLRGSADYLEPNQGVTPDSLKSSQWKEGYSSENSLAEPLLHDSTSRSSELLLSNHVNHRRPLTATLSLDASTLARQPIPYGKHSPAVRRNGGDTTNDVGTSHAYTVPANGRIHTDAEISC